MDRRPGQLQQPPERAHVGGSSNPQPPIDLQPAAVPLHPTGGTSLCSGFDSPRNIGKFREIHHRNSPKIDRHQSSLPSLMEIPVSSRRPLVHWRQSRRAPCASSSSEVMRPMLSMRSAYRINLHMRRGEAVGATSMSSSPWPSQELIRCGQESGAPERPGARICYWFYYCSSRKR
jgi:hypothetical protein